jgi:UDP-N-acetylglucosamine 2-epimerase (non-hydrolysing)
MKKIMLIAGARPNFMKIAPLCRAFDARGIEFFLVHTGQHYDIKMSEVFFSDLDIPFPHVNLDIGSGERISQTKKILDRLVPVLEEQKPDAILVVGDVLSTAAAAMAALVTDTPLIHVEAGLRSFNWAMPEELNRMIADHHSDLLFVSDPSGMKHLLNEGIPEERVHYVGNIMIDALKYAEQKTAQSTVLRDLNLQSKQYGVLTMHRPENVDHEEILQELVGALRRIAEEMPLIFPIHPRTKKQLDQFSISLPKNIRCIDPQGYVDMLTLVKNAKLALTDSGGLQEETAVLDVPCLTLRQETERPITVTHGTSEVVGHDAEKIYESFRLIMRDEWKKNALPDYWDGKTAERIADILNDYEF